MFIKFEGKEPTQNGEIIVFDGAKIIGDVRIDKGANIWYNAVVRGDDNYITIGENTNIQDNCSIHITVDLPTIIGKNVTIGHNAVVHACTIEDNCLIGMNATVLDGAVIGAGSIVGANALVTGNTIIPPNSLVLGSPAKAVKEINVAQNNIDHAIAYVELAKKYN